MLPTSFVCYICSIAYCSAGEREHGAFPKTCCLLVGADTYASCVVILREINQISKMLFHVVLLSSSFGESI